ncbi:hypothetical protein GGF46_005277 [Coemansia sp. RSA 552]|nr:hypothetical protein GGF46_005277 [Coemansia sp. RSA 552]
MFCAVIHLVQHSHVLLVTLYLLLQAVSSLSALLLHYAQYKRSPVPSDALLGYWLASACLSLVMTHKEARHMPPSVAKVDATLVQGLYVCAAAAAFVSELTTRPSSSHHVLDCDCEGDDNCWTKKQRSSSQKPANIFSRLLFTWVTPAIDSGFVRGRYRQEDLFDVPRAVAGANMFDKFLAEWDTQDPADRTSLLRVLCRGIRHDVAISGFYMALSSVAQLLQPLVLKKLIGFFAHHNREMPADEGLILALAMGSLGLVRAVAYQAHWHVLMKPYLWLENVLAALVYRKLLRLSNESRAKHTTGEIASYLGIDVGAVATSINYVHYVWDHPARIVIVLFMLYQTLGWASITGVVLLLLSTYISGRLAGVVRNHVTVFAERRDQRMRVLSEMLTNMKGIKMYAWQGPFIDQIQHIRVALELAALRRVGAWKSVITLATSLITVLIGLATFAVYIFLDGASRGPLTPELIFVSLSLFMLLEEPLAQGPTVVSTIVNAARSYSRLCNLVASSELDWNAVTRDLYDRQAPDSTPDDVLVDVRDASFKWLSTDEPTLKNVSLQCRRQELVAVVGRVGAGKSSLVSAILGDMIKSSGTVAVRGSVAYVPQQAWIVNATLRENILFGNPLDQELYERVVWACALTHDLEMLPAGDMTEIGEKGINLSGGQKARVSLARAVYARADVYILDDPLAAVDAHVGKHIFTHVLGPAGILKTRARILVTNAVEYLGTVSNIVMLEGTAAYANDLDYKSVVTRASGSSGSLNTSEDDAANPICHGQTQTEKKVPSSTQRTEPRGVDISHDSPGRKVIREEAQELGGVGWNSSQIHSLVLHSVIRSPMSFFDATPIGRLLGLFSSDQSQIDDNMPFCIELAIKGFIQMLVALMLIVISAPVTLLFLVPLSFVYAKLHRRFMPMTRDTRRMVNTTRNIAISSAEEAISGCATIRAFSREAEFQSKHARCTKEYLRAWWTYLCANRWLAVRLDVISALVLFLTGTAFIAVRYVMGSVDSGYVGLSMTYALSLVGVLNICIRNTTLLELALISVERARSYSNLSPEAPELIEDNTPQDVWPEQGLVEFKNYSTRYRDGLPLVLNHLSFRVEPRQKVGIVGRTGAGKSSLTLALFRIVEAAEGQILLDGEDISQYGLFDVRSRLSIIPQDPVLFAGTVRENLDPFSKYTDQEIWNALEHAHLAEFIRTKADQLEFEVTQGGENFSVGQRQLICLARALLKRAKILVLDEATAAIDNSTDAIIQESIRREFQDCTVLTIAHRLNTIIDNDKILVIDAGRVAEFDTPKNLLKNKESLFAKLIQESSASTGPKDGEGPEDEEEPRP